jgi:hypothetical protein
VLKLVRKLALREELGLQLNHCRKNVPDDLREKGLDLDIEETAPDNGPAIGQEQQRLASRRAVGRDMPLLAAQNTERVEGAL